MVENNKTYSSIEEILQRKLQLTGEMASEERKIRRLWNGLFHETKKKEPTTPAQRLISLVTNGTGIIDGVILGWKLYMKFKK